MENLPTRVRKRKIKVRIDWKSLLHFFDKKTNKMTKITRARAPVMKERTTMVT